MWAVERISETELVRTAPAGNGAGPLWCYGAPLVLRAGERVYASVLETGEGIPPLSNCRWQLWSGDDAGWKLLHSEESFREREPCPIVLFGDGAVLLSANPSTEPPGTQYGPCLPEILAFAPPAHDVPPRREAPAWTGQPAFTDHSYRGIAADRELRELLLLHIDAETSEQMVSHRDASGIWHARDGIRFPIRAAYPQAALRDGAAHVLAIGDIVEPNAEWRALKKEVTGSEWDYVFRRLFYAFTPDLAEHPFGSPLEVDSVEATGGHILNLDLYIDGRGEAHVLYLKRPHVHAFLRDRFFPGEPMTASLEYAVVRAGEIVARRTLGRHPPVAGMLDPVYARFHVLPGERLLVVAAGHLAGPDGAVRFVNVLLDPSRERGEPLCVLPLTEPFRLFFTASPRSGSPPSAVLDLFGTGSDGALLRHAALRILEPGVACAK
ncbi:MAG TPA: hypothetical protein VMN36_03955 [Verrucomicrobiales bacterium]|nr:hypothetical protein [Verrucomicrobiales bacterium]